ncbi:MAG: ethanolamine ammonia-lyase reactivating factor EutA [Clostridia bacterium]|nr:ethanolamine ammonia-lyase reactivating factor EutA [Clostridia bacterium]
MENGACEVINSIGIDIGTTTTQLVISQLTIKNVAPGSLVPRMQITEKVIIYKSKIYRTPILEDGLIDAESIYYFIDFELREAGFKPDSIQTGAVIITGETAKKENARRISNKIADFMGDFVVATAGGCLEGIIAGKGSGACEYSLKHYCTVANIDVGGGTANIGIFKNGEVIDSCCINVGARLLQLDSQSGKILKIEEPLNSILKYMNVQLQEGSLFNKVLFDDICSNMALIIWNVLFGISLPQEISSLILGDPIGYGDEIDVIMFSGGVADWIYETSVSHEIPQLCQYGDVGPLLGERIKVVFESKGRVLTRPTETIRATVIGAGSQTLDVSGSTILVDNDLLPLKNIPVLLPFKEAYTLTEDGIKLAVQNSIRLFANYDFPTPIAIAISGKHCNSFEEMKIYAKGIIAGLRNHIEEGYPIIIILEQDAGKVMGQSIKAHCSNSQIICIDQLKVAEGDYIDIGKAISGGSVVPVVIKTLVFESNTSMC